MPFRFSLPLVTAATLALTAIAPGVRAQNSADPKSFGASQIASARIVGVVIDSVHGKYLSGAEIIIDGGRASLHTDSLGRFEVDSLRAGIYQVGVLHPLLDSLGITLLTQPFRISADTTNFVMIAVPSAPTLVRRACPSVAGLSAVIGHVADPETLEPVARAEVSIAWVDIEISKKIGIVRKPRLLRAVTDSLGAFRICGLPNELQASLQAKRGSSETAEIPISLGDRPVELLARTVFLSLSDSSTKNGTAVVSGVVVLEGSPTKAGTRVELVGRGNAVVTNEDGEFSMRNVPSGTAVLVARHVGFDVESVPVDLSSREDARVAIRLRKSVPAMEAVRVMARKMAVLDKIGFTERRKTGFGFFIGPERLDQMHPSSVTDILQQAPGLYVVRRANGDAIASSHTIGGTCIEYYLDGGAYLETRPGDINKFVNGADIAAVEVYQGNAPVEYARAGVSCITIVLWTRGKVHG